MRVSQSQTSSNYLDIEFIMQQFHKDLAISFTGYGEFIEEYRTMAVNDLDNIHTISTVALLWCNYLSEIEALLKLVLCEIEDTYLAYKAYYNTDNEVTMDLLRQRKVLTLFRKTIHSKKKQCTFIHYNTDSIYKSGMRSLKIGKN